MMIRAEVDSANVMASNDDGSSAIPYSFDLKQNYPNPFNPTTKIEFSLATNGSALITLYDITGRKIKDLVSQNFSAGRYFYNLNAKNLPSGMYFYKMQVKDNVGNSTFNATKKMFLMK